MITHVIIWGATSLHRAAWAALLTPQPGIRVVGAAAAVADVLALLVPEQPSAFLIDAPAPQAEFVRQLRAAYPASGMLVLVAAYDVDQLTTLFQAGATGCLGYNQSVSDLARSLIAVGRGEVVLPPAVAADVLMRLARSMRVHDQRSERLSERKIEVIRLLARGYTNKDIAQTLVLSVRTVEAHLRTVYGKIGARSRTAAALWAVRHGYGRED